MEKPARAGVCSSSGRSARNLPVCGSRANNVSRPSAGSLGSAIQIARCIPEASHRTSQSLSGWAPTIWVRSASGVLAADGETEDSSADGVPADGLGEVTSDSWLGALAGLSLESDPFGAGEDDEGAAEIDCQSSSTRRPLAGSQVP